MCVVGEAHTFAFQIRLHVFVSVLGPRQARAILTGGYRNPTNTTCFSVAAPDDS